MEGLQLGKLAIEVSAEGVDKAKQQVDSLQSSVEKTGQGSKGVSGLGNSFKELTGKLKDTISQQKICGTTVGGLVDKFKSATGVTDLTSMAVGGLTTACVALAVEGIAKLGESLDEIAGAGDRIDKMSQKMNISAEAFQQWDSIAQHNGSSIEAYAGIMKKLGMTLEQNADLYNQLGVATTNIDGSLRSNNEIFQDTIIKLGEMEDVNQRNAIATELFGRQAAELYPLLNSGADGIREQVEASKEAVIYTDQYVKSSANLCDASQRLGEQMDGMKVSLLGGMVQPLADMKNTISDVIVQLQPLLSLIGTLAGGLLQGVADAFKLVGKAIELLLQAVNLVIKPIKELVDLILEISQPIKDAWNDMVDNFGVSTEKGMDNVNDAMSKGQEGIVDSIEKGGEDQQTSFQEIYDEIESMTDKHYDNLKQMAEEYNGELQANDKAYEEWKRDNLRQLEKEYDDSHQLLTLMDYKAKEKYMAEMEQAIDNRIAIDKRKNEKAYTDKLSKEKAHVDAMVECEKTKQDAINSTTKALKEQSKQTESAIDKIKNLAKGIIDVFTMGSFSESIKLIKGGIKHNAIGSSYYTGGLTMVGETGRELVELPRGSRIYNNRETEQIMSDRGGNNTYQINVTIPVDRISELNDVTEFFNNYKYNVRMGV